MRISRRLNEFRNNNIRQLYPNIFSLSDIFSTFLSCIPEMDFYNSGLVFKSIDPH